MPHSAHRRSCSHRIQGDDGIAYAIPLYGFIFLVALGADYTIFLMSRVREETACYGMRQHPDRPATHGRRDHLRLPDPRRNLPGADDPTLRDLYQLGIAVALGVLLDTFVVRALLVPGIVILLGRWNSWPSRLKTPPASLEPASDR